MASPLPLMVDRLALKKQELGWRYDCSGAIDRYKKAMWGKGMRRKKTESSHGKMEF